MYESSRKPNQEERRRRKRRGRIPSHTTIRCPMNGFQVSWCRMLCEPIGELGLCGRPAPHRLKGRTQLAIAGYNATTGTNV